MTATGPCAWCKTACVTAPVLGRAESPALLRPRTTSGSLLIRDIEVQAAACRQ
jgi:hypothetical protein